MRKASFGLLKTCYECNNFELDRYGFRDFWLHTVLLGNMNYSSLCLCELGELP